MLTPEVQQAIERAVREHVARLAPRERYNTPKETGAIMNCHVDTVLRFVRAGKLRAVGEGQLLRIPDSAIREYFDNPKRRGRS